MARITIDLSKGVFEVEGSEEFVEKRFTEFQPQLASAIQKSNPVLQQSKQDLLLKQPKRIQTKKHTGKVEVPDVFKKIDMLPISLASGVVYSKLKTAQERLLWSLALAKELGIDGLESGDIVWLTDKSGMGIPKQQIVINYQRVRNKGFANQSTLTNKMRITDEGVNYINSIFIKQKVE